jgi:hypothetical protein
VIADKLLLDWKAGGVTKIVSRREIWQLLGYFVADSNDRYRIERVGISAVRWRRRELVGRGPARDARSG